ncbi:hypothetical protein G6F28_007083 [Rhizopus arrhizus]|nr:hypothetical protein G6F28_007083 [Rhizopus arrhizus]
MKTTPSKEYLESVKQPSVTLKEPKEQLLILDLNGTLVSIARRNACMYVRPFSDLFFDYIFQHFTVMVWSSARSESVNYMCRIFGSLQSKLALIWDHFSLGPSFSEHGRKVVTIKDLEKVWQHFEPGRFDVTNTILLDDSAHKAVLQPFNLIQPTKFQYHSSSFLSSGECELMQLLSYLKSLRYQSNVSNYIHSHPYQPILNHKDNSFKVLKFILGDDKSSLVDLTQHVDE